MFLPHYCAIHLKEMSFNFTVYIFMYSRLEIATILVAYAPEMQSVRLQNIFGSICASANNCCGVTSSVLC